MAEPTHRYLALTNIPSDFHAADLRSHFSLLVESGTFLCFHFRHRPEKNSISSVDKDNKNGRKLCCVVKILGNKLEDVMRYNQQNWTNVHGDYLADRCQLSQIQLTSSGTSQDTLDAVEEDRLLQMPELKAPDLMPQGNVGTPTLVFLELIQQCLLPHNLINKLHLRFPKTSGRRIYANVQLDYSTTDSLEHQGRQSRSRHNILIRKPLAKSKVSSKVEADTQHQSVAQGLGCEKAQLEGESEPDRVADVDVIERSSNEAVMGVGAESESSSLEKVAGVAAVQSSGSDRVPHKDGNHLCANLKQPSSAAIGDHSLQSLPSKSHVSGSHPEFTSILGFIGCKSSPSSHAFIRPVELPQMEDQKLTNRQRKRLKKHQQLGIRQLKAENIEEKLIAVESRYHNDDDAEEWDRHEASEDDPSNQERNKERLYEEEIEQPWEKGGPGVVFYTDAAFWQEREGDFDEQTTDDLDVDFSVYEGDGVGDKDIQDFLKIQQEKRYREGYDNTDRFSIGIGKRLPESTSGRSTARVGTFECHSKGIGRKLMERQGWRDGQGLGRSVPGIVDALKGEGQGSHNKSGLGYTQVKPMVYTSKKPQAHLITTIYDNPKATDPKEPLLHRSEPSTLKHRQTHMDRFA